MYTHWKTKGDKCRCKLNWDCYPSTNHVSFLQSRYPVVCAQACCMEIAVLCIFGIKCTSLLYWTTVIAIKTDPNATPNRTSMSLQWFYVKFFFLNIGFVTCGTHCSTHLLPSSHRGQKVFIGLCCVNLTKSISSLHFTASCLRLPLGDW